MTAFSSSLLLPCLFSVPFVFFQFSFPPPLFPSVPFFSIDSTFTRLFSLLFPPRLLLFHQSPFSLFPCFHVNYLFVDCSKIQLLNYFFVRFHQYALVISRSSRLLPTVKQPQSLQYLTALYTDRDISQRSCNTTFIAVLQQVFRCSFETLMGLANEQLAPAGAIRLVQMRCCNRGASKEASKQAD